MAHGYVQRTTFDITIQRDQLLNKIDGLSRLRHAVFIMILIRYKVQVDLF